MKISVLLILALALAFGCVQEGAETRASEEAVDEPVTNVPVAPDNGGSDAPANGTAAPQVQAENGEVTLEVKFTEIELESGTVEIRKPNPECYPDAEKCGMMDEPMHIFEEARHEYYNLSSGGDVCLLSMENVGSDSLYLLEYTVENHGSQPRIVSPELLVKSENQKMGYLVSTPHSEENCTGFYDGSDLDIELGPSESMDFKALLIIPGNETPLSASIYAGEN